MITPNLTPRLLITGGAGFIGSHLTNELVKKRFSVTVIDNLKTGKEENLHSDVKLIVDDVRNETLMKQLSPVTDAVIHLAGVVGMRLAHQAAHESYVVSTMGTKLLFNNFKSPIVLVSSSAIYGFLNSNAVNENQKISEDDAISYDGGKNGYATGKLAMENIGKAYSTQQPVLIIRPFNVVGLGQVGTYGMVVPTFIQNAIQNKPLTVYDDGLQRRSFSDISTFNQCLLDLVACKSAWNANENIFNIGNTTDNSILELANLVISSTGTNPGIKFVPYQKIFPNKSDVRNRKPDISHLESQIGSISWPGIRQIIDKIIMNNNALQPGQ